MTYPAIAEGYRERLLKVLVSHDLATILREIGEDAVAAKTALHGRHWLLTNWDNDIRDRVMTIINNNLEITK